MTTTAPATPSTVAGNPRPAPKARRRTVVPSFRAPYLSEEALSLLSEAKRAAIEEDRKRRRREWYEKQRAEAARSLEHARFLASGYQTIEEYRRAQERSARVLASIEAAKAKSKELYEAEAEARWEAERHRFDGTFEKPEKPSAPSRPVVWRGGSPGLNKKKR
ncbi:hypothetical protein [Leifsonia sp. AG29]|uniref:hypothetical protein n=1 Tax=Leifsonia sp. AG29 TaxID=2598860 RepID=UPI00131C0811|nr:hypothetical protein [Leifsonia sp. AG29]